MTGLTLDTGALIAIEAGSRRMAPLIEQAMAVAAELAIPAGVIAPAELRTSRASRIVRYVRQQANECGTLIL